MWLLTAGVPPAALDLWFSPVRKCRDLPATRREPPVEARSAAAATA